ncbi:asparagine synthase-domain-containing protein [Mucidula mucida]|nr:asparagine synthase-domain-containing protein [Mucidula mucida]
MCGIFVTAHFQGSHTDEVANRFESLSIALRDANALRGPDAQRRHVVSLDDGNGSHTLELDFFASELRLRGTDHSVDQPHIRGQMAMCFVGTGRCVEAEQNDGVRLFDMSSDSTVEELRDLFGSVEGPYAFVFYVKSTNQLLFARDPLGRRSLLIHKPTPSNPYFMLASVACGASDGYSFQDISTEHIYCLSLSGLEKEVNMEDNFDSHLSHMSRSSSHPSSIDFTRPAAVNVSIPPEDWPHTTTLDIVPNHLEDSVDDLISHLDKSVMLRVQNIPRPPSAPCTQARVAVLFSGGIDSTIITYLAHRHIPLDEPIDLLNVAFENPRKARVALEGNPGKKQKKKHARADCELKASPPTSYLVPDRKTGLEQLEELRALCPGRTWNFVSAIRAFESSALKGTVESLMFPNRTVMDLSLALALYFASRGVGQIRDNPGAEPTPYTSPARVLLNGLGSDELLGGYGRHRSAYKSGGWQAVIEELQLEIDRIPLRNLGRDDRIISSHGKETRHPFLSLRLLKFLAELPIQKKMDPRADVGLGDKMLLRLAARKLGLVGASSRKKRAMQFGSHSARMEGDSKGDAMIE